MQYFLNGKSVSLCTIELSIVGAITGLPQFCLPRAYLRVASSPCSHLPPRSVGPRAKPTPMAALATTWDFFLLIAVFLCYLNTPSLSIWLRNWCKNGFAQFSVSNGTCGLWAPPWVLTRWRAPNKAKKRLLLVDTSDPTDIYRRQNGGI